MNANHIALASSRTSDTQYVGMPREASDASLEVMAEEVRRSDATRSYWVVDALSIETVVYRWYVNAGFTHREGWWVIAEEG